MSSNNSIKGSDNRPICAITLEELDEKVAIGVTNCKHQFVYDAILNYVTEYSSKCPNCRAEITEITKKILDESGNEIEEVIAVAARTQQVHDNIGLIGYNQGNSPYSSIASPISPELLTRLIEIANRRVQNLVVQVQSLAAPIPAGAEPAHAHHLSTVPMFIDLPDGNVGMLRFPIASRQEGSFARGGSQQGFYRGQVISSVLTAFRSIDQFHQALANRRVSRTPHVEDVD